MPPFLTNFVAIPCALGLIVDPDVLDREPSLLTTILAKESVNVLNEDLTL